MNKYERMTQFQVMPKEEYIKKCLERLRLLEDRIENGTLVEKDITTEKALDIACRLLDDLTGNCPQCYEYDVDIDCDRECANLDNATSSCWKKYCIEQAEVEQKLKELKGEKE